jgi:hypothetical protein
MHFVENRGECVNAYVVVNTELQDRPFRKQNKLAPRSLEAVL